MREIVLSNGVKMPAIVMSTNYMDYPLMKNVVTAGLELGYRAFDTARDYGNEHIVGRVLDECLHEQGLRREDTLSLPRLAMASRLRAILLSR